MVLRPVPASRPRIRQPDARLALAIEAETEPFRQAWLALSPGQRLLRSWRMRRQLKDPEAAHDARSLPRL